MKLQSDPIGPTADSARPLAECTRFRRDRMPTAAVDRHFCPEQVDSRRRWLRAATGAECEALFGGTLDAASCAGNIENFVGALQVPVGIAGPLRVIGDSFDDFLPLPLATTEGALVRSLHRGALICNLAGGIRVHIRRQRISRAPVYVCRSLDHALRLEQWVLDNKDKLREQAESCSRHARLQQIETIVFDRTLHIEFSFSTKDAAGQNMVTACTWGACEWIREQIERDPSIGYERYQIEGNLSGDKKLSARSSTLGRGYAVTARCVVPEQLLRRFFGVDAATFLDAYQIAQAGSAHAGLSTFNVNFANAVAAIFLACGQDVASVHEAGAGYFQVTPAPNGVAIAAHLPSLPVGSVGGGTALPTQAECLSMLGCSAPGSGARLAAVIGAACLALDLSTGGAIAGGQFAAAHQRLGRNPPPKSRESTELARLIGVDPERIVRSEHESLDSEDDVMCRIRTRIGSGSLNRYRIHLDGEPEPRTIVIKQACASDAAGPLPQLLAAIAGDDSLVGLLEGGLDSLDLGGSARREWAFYRHADPIYRAFAPRVLGLSDPRREGEGAIPYTVALEDLGGSLHLRPEGRWSSDHIRLTLNAMARFHALAWQRRPVWLDSVRPAQIESSTALGRELRRRLLARAIDSGELSLSTGVHRLLESDHRPEAFPGTPRFRTVIHNDLSTRNVCLRSRPGGPEPVFYDWEFVTWGAPQRDLLEFLTHALEPARFQTAFAEFYAFYLRALSDVLPDAPSRAEFSSELPAIARELFLSRSVPLALLRDTLGLDWLPPVLSNMTSVLQYGVSMERAA